MWELLRKDIREHWKAAVFLVLSAAIFVKCFGAACISQLMVGLPCPACGMTRAALLFLSGHWAESFQMQPFFYAVIAGMCLFLICRYGLKKYQHIVQYYAVIMLAAAIAFYVYRMVRYFPDMPPMTYREENLLYLVLHMWKN